MLEKSENLRSIGVAVTTSGFITTRTDNATYYVCGFLANSLRKHKATTYENQWKF